MLENPLAQFVLELIRSLLVEETSDRVRKPLARLRFRHDTRDYRRALLIKVHRRNRDRLLHRLLTGLREEL